MPRKDLTKSQVLSQFFTDSNVARYVVETTRRVLQDTGKRWQDLYFVDAGAGEGVFTNLLPKGRTVPVEVDPDLLRRNRHYVPADIATGGFLSMSARDLGLQSVPTSQIVVGWNPPYSVPRENGRSNNVAMEFVNHAAQLGDTVAMILPNTFRRPRTQDQVDRRLHLIHDENIPSNSFTLDGAPASVTTVFQIWQTQQDRAGRPILRELDPWTQVVKGGDWGGDFTFVKSTDPRANVRICNWGSHATVGRLDPLRDVPQLVRQNQIKYQQHAGTRKSFEPDNSHYYLCAVNPRATHERFAERKYLFEELAEDRTMGNNPDLTVGDMVRIYVSPVGTHYVAGQWIEP